MKEKRGRRPVCAQQTTGRAQGQVNLSQPSPAHQRTTVRVRPVEGAMIDATLTANVNREEQRGDATRKRMHAFERISTEKRMYSKH